MTQTSCFKAYDIRGEIGVNIDEDVCFNVGRAVANHFSAKSVILSFDARETSPAFAEAVADGVQDAGSNVIDIGLAGTEEMYWAVTQFKACAGIAVTASHNPINYNGMKIVKSGSRPLNNKTDFQIIKKLSEEKCWSKVSKRGRRFDCSNEARLAYVDRIVSFLDCLALRPLKIVVNSGNGAAGPTFDAISKRLLELGAPLEFVRVQHSPDSSFPNGIPNPMLPHNHAATADIVRKERADFGIAFDGDFDRCFFFDEVGSFVQGEIIVGLIASVFLEREPGAKIIHDGRLIWNTQDIINAKGGIGVLSKTGHAFIKEAMRKHKGVYGGEASAHHYFRDFAYCDSGMIPWMLIAQLVSKANKSLGDCVVGRLKAFPSLNETNFSVQSPTDAIERVLLAYRQQAISLDKIDGLSMSFADWRFNLRQSNTEPLVRLNIEGKNTKNCLEKKKQEIAGLLGGIIS